MGKKKLDRKISQNTRKKTTHFFILFTRHTHKKKKNKK
jgi:hypothetical protein